MTEGGRGMWEWGAQMFRPLMRKTGIVAEQGGGGGGGQHLEEGRRHRKKRQRRKSENVKKC